MNECELVCNDVGNGIRMRENDVGWKFEREELGGKKMEFTQPVLGEFRKWK